MAESDVLWTSDNPAYGVVRRVLFCGDYAAQFDDLNGDLREVCLTLFKRGASGWEGEYSQDDVAYPADEADSASYGLSGGCQVLWAYGSARPWFAHQGMLPKVHLPRGVPLGKCAFSNIP